jgi:hypothetical protein
VEWHSPDLSPGWRDRRSKEWVRRSIAAETLAMNYYMIRSFDHAGYYETRLILMVVGLVVAGRFAARGDWRYLVMFASGVLFQALLELLIMMLGLRGARYRLSVFGLTLPPAVAFLLQGCAEGGILTLMSFWFADLVLGARSERSRWPAYFATCGLIVALATLVGWYAAGKPISSPRPMFAPSGILVNDATITTSLLLLWLKGGQDGFRYLGYWYLGAVVYYVLNFEPMHLFGARTIATRTSEGQYVPAALPTQAAVMAWAGMVEFAAGKLHYFVVPYILGLVRFPESRS